MNSISDITKKQNLYISLFEPQLIRSYLLADNSNFLMDLHKNFNVYIVTSTKLKNLVSQGIEEASLNGFVRTILFDDYSDSIFSRVVNFALYWSNQSPAINLKIFRLRTENTKKIISFFRILVNKCFPRHEMLTRLLRFILFKSMKNNSLARCFSEYIPYNPSNLVFITSLTNTWEDLPVAIYFKKNQARVIGTVRSWDNLTNHGYLKFVPDIFVHHSEAMKNYARNFQNMTNNSDILLVTPVYQNKFRVKKQNKAADITNVAYMCMGKITNPDDEHFAQWLIKEWGLLPNKFNLTIVQHPKFSISINDSNMGGNIGIKVFNYSESNLIDYYNFIAEQDVIICGGTTAALDSAFIRTPTIAIGFEITEQNYWASALRYFDTKPHTKDFFNMCNVLVISNKQDLVNTLVSSDDILCLSDELVSYFTGNSNIDFNQALISVLKTF